MRKIILALLLLIVLAGGGVGVLWLLQSAKIEKKFTEQVAQFNTGPMRLTYDALNLSGFPLRMDLTLVNPKLAGRADLLLDPNKQRNLPEWDGTSALQGNARLGIDMFSSQAEFSLTGALQNTSVIGGQTLSLSSPDITAQCRLRTARNSAWIYSMWSFAGLAGRGKEFLSDFRLFDCFTHNLKIVDTQSNTTLMESGPQRFYISSDPQGDKRQVRFYVKGTDSFVTPDGDRMITRYYSLFMPNALSPMLSAYGKQNAEIDFTYTGPIDWQGDPKTMPIEAHLARFNLTNDAYVINSTFDLANSTDAQMQSSRLAFKSEATYNQIYNALAHETVRSMIQQMLSDPKTAAALSTLKNVQNAENLYTLIAPIIPDFYALGKLTSSLDLSFQGAPGFASGDFTLSDLELSVTPYGFTGKGTAKRVPGVLMPTMSLSLVCRNCLQLIDAVTGYINRIHTFTATVTPERSSSALDAATIHGYKKLLQEIAADDGAGNFTYAIASDGKSGYTVNKKRMDEVLMLYHQYVPQRERR